MPSMDRFTWVPDLTPTPRTSLPLHMWCPNCESTYGKGYVVHTDTCPTPTWVFDSRTDSRLVK